MRALLLFACMIGCAPSVQNTPARLTLLQTVGHAAPPFEPTPMLEQGESLSSAGTLPFARSVTTRPSAS